MKSLADEYKNDLKIKELKSLYLTRDFIPHVLSSSSYMEEDGEVANENLESTKRTGDISSVSTTPNKPYLEEDDVIVNDNLDFTKMTEEEDVIENDNLEFKPAKKHKLSTSMVDPSSPPPSPILPSDTDTHTATLNSDKTDTSGKNDSNVDPLLPVQIPPSPATNTKVDLASSTPTVSETAANFL